MSTFEHARLTLSRPAHGWLPVRFEIGDYRIECDASAVLQDPLSEFAELLRFLARPRELDAECCVCLWLETETYWIRVNAQSRGDVRVRVSYAEEGQPRPEASSSGHIQFDGAIHSSRLAVAVCTGMKQLLDDDFPASEWNDPGHARAVLRDVIDLTTGVWLQSVVGALRDLTARSLQPKLVGNREPRRARQQSIWERMLSHFGQSTFHDPRSQFSIGETYTMLFQDSQLGAALETPGIVVFDEATDGRLRELDRTLDRLFRAGRDEAEGPDADFDEARRLAIQCMEVVGRIDHDVTNWIAARPAR